MHSDQPTAAGTYSDQLAAVRQSLQARGIWACSDEWLSECLAFLAESCGGRQLSPAELCHQVARQWLDTDLEEIGTPALPARLAAAAGVTRLARPCAVQLLHAVDVGQPAHGQLLRLRRLDSANTALSSEPAARWEPRPSRALRLTLTDGVQTVTALEYRPVPALTADLPAGLKLLLRADTECRRGVLLLTADAVQVLGGCVDRLQAAHAQERVLERRLGPAAAARSAPADADGGGGGDGGGDGDGAGRPEHNGRPPDDHLFDDDIDESELAAIGFDDDVDDSELAGIDMPDADGGLDVPAAARSPPEPVARAVKWPRLETSCSGAPAGGAPPRQRPAARQQRLEEFVKSAATTAVGVSVSSAPVTAVRPPPQAEPSPWSSASVTAVRPPPPVEPSPWSSASVTTAVRPPPPQEPSSWSSAPVTTAVKSSPPEPSSWSSDVLTPSPPPPAPSPPPPAPFGYLSQLRPGATVTVKAFIMTQVSRLSTADGRWSLGVMLNDGTCSTEVQLTDAPLRELIGSTVGEVTGLKAAARTNAAARLSLKRVLDGAQRAVIDLNCLMTVEAGRDGGLPQVTAVTPVTADTVRALRASLEWSPDADGGAPGSAV